MLNTSGPLQKLQRQYIDHDFPQLNIYRKRHDLIEQKIVPLASKCWAGDPLSTIKNQ